MTSPFPLIFSQDVNVERTKSVTKVVRMILVFMVYWIYEFLVKILAI
jgi:uncharacterized membrane protein